jgi:hypothetical protein
VYDELVQNGNLFVLGSLVQKRKGWLWFANVFIHTFFFSSPLCNCCSEWTC